MSASQPKPALLPIGLSAAREGSTGLSRLEDDVVELFDQQRDRLLRYLLSFGLPVQDGEEIVQEVFLFLFRHLKQGKSRRNLRGWIFRVAHNLALKRRTRKFSASHDPLHENLFVDPRPSPEDQMASSEQHQRLLAVLRALPEQDQRCLALRAEGLRYREIAEVLDMSLGAVSISLSRSLARFARANEW